MQALTSPPTLYASLISIKISNTPNYTAVVPFGNLDSEGDGAGIYLKNGVLEVYNITVDLVNADYNGGFIYADEIVQINITFSNFTNHKADRGSFIYAMSSAA